MMGILATREAGPGQQGAGEGQGRLSGTAVSAEV